MSHGPAAAPRAREISLAEWAEMGEDEPGELVDGQLVEEEEVGALHDIVAGWVCFLLMSWLAPRGGVVGVSDSRFGVSPRRGRKPDLYAYFAGRRPPPHGLVTIAPDIMVEVVSPRPRDARRDRVEKMREYAAFGVNFYWVVDPALRTFEIAELGKDGRYAHAIGATGGVIQDVPGCEGLVIDLDALWAEVEKLDPQGTGG